jgi:hypothetical protein
MLKFLLTAAVITPAVIYPFVGTAKSKMVAYNKVSFEDVHIAPEFKQLENCKSAELDVFFHDNYITTHSSEYIAEGLELAANCGTASYTITPVVPSISYVSEDVVRGPHAQELLLVLRAHGVNAKIANTEFQDDFDSLTANGRTAKLKIDFDKNSNSFSRFR